jgi:hypothetical protein
MLKKTGLFLISLVLLAAVAPVYAQDDSTSAILVIDVFEMLESAASADRIERPRQDENCLTNPAGQGHPYISGASAFVTTGQGHPYISGASATGTVPPHGRLVYDQIVDLLEDRSASLDRETNGEDEFGEEWLRDITLWDVEEGTVILAGVDTDGYTTAAIVDRIPATMEYLSKEWGVNKFVVNMSFAIIPCSDLEVARVENVERYEEILDEKFPDLVTRVGERTEENLLDSMDRAEFTEARLTFESEIAEEAFDSFYRRDLRNYNENFFNSDPLYRLLEQLHNSTARNREYEVISIASAGNLGYDYPLAPGYWASVVSVSGDYGDLAKCSGVSGQPLSNAGEVMMNGIHPYGSKSGGCLIGTSFAAPRLSLETALYMVAGGSLSCSGSSGASSPPLAHLPWDDLERVDAADEYCTDFNDLVH